MYIHYKDQNIYIWTVNKDVIKYYLNLVKNDVDPYVLLNMEDNKQP